MNLLRGLTAAVVLLAFGLGVTLGHNARATAEDVRQAKAQAFSTATKQARIKARGEAFNNGLRDGMIEGRRRGAERGKAAAQQQIAGGPSGVTGATTVSGGAEATGPTGSQGR